MLHRSETFPNLRELSLSGNALESFDSEGDPSPSKWHSVQVLMLEENNFMNLTCLEFLTRIFPDLTAVSFRDNKISAIDNPQEDNDATAAPTKELDQYSSITSLNLSYNAISSFGILNRLPKLFPNLHTLQISNNPLYTATSSTVSQSEMKNFSDANYYLTLARLPDLQVLNYTTITPRDREEGELYYLSTINTEVDSVVSTALNSQPQLDRSTLAAELRTTHPRYDTLCRKYDRPDQITLSLESQAILQQPADPQTQSFTQKYSNYPPGSIGHKLIKAHFHIPSVSASASAAIYADLAIPRTIPTSTLCAILQRTPALQPHLRPLQYRLVYESTELDPVDTTAEGGTRSTLYARQGVTEAERRAVWEEWGDWDADAVGFEAAGLDGEEAAVTEAISNATTGEGGHWIEDRGERILIRDGRRWRRREVEILKSVKRAWGDWIESDVREITVRIEPFVVTEG